MKRPGWEKEGKRMQGTAYSNIKGGGVFIMRGEYA